jgi:hypothetical protein
MLISNSRKNLINYLLYNCQLTQGLLYVAGEEDRNTGSSNKAIVCFKSFVNKDNRSYLKFDIEVSSNTLERTLRLTDILMDHLAPQTIVTSVEQKSDADNCDCKYCIISIDVPAAITSPVFEEIFDAPVIIDIELGVHLCSIENKINQPIPRLVEFTDNKLVDCCN